MYEEFTKRFIKNQHKIEGIGLPCEVFPNKSKASVFTKECTLRKIKRIKIANCKSFDNGRKLAVAKS